MIQHVEQLIENLRGEPEQRLQFGRYGPRWRPFTPGTDESDYAIAYLKFRLGQLKREPKLPARMTQREAERLRHRVDEALDRP